MSSEAQGVSTAKNKCKSGHSVWARFNVSVSFQMGNMETRAAFFVGAWESLSLVLPENAVKIFATGESWGF